MSLVKNRTQEVKSVFSNSETYVSIISKLFILLFLYAATSKLINYEKSEFQMSKSPIIADFAFILAWLVPVIEIIIVMLIMIPRTLLLGLFGAFVMMIMFTGYIYAILNFSDSIPCSCGGILAAMNWNQHLIFNIVFVLLAITSILLQNKIEQNKVL